MPTPSPADALPETTALTPAEVLRRAADLIEPEGAWTKNANARTGKGGRETPPTASDARCWCVIGAIRRVSGFPLGSAALANTLGAVKTSLPHPWDQRPVHAWNDSSRRRQAEVVAALRKAAARAEATQ